MSDLLLTAGIPASLVILFLLGWCGARWMRIALRQIQLRLGSHDRQQIKAAALIVSAAVVLFYGLSQIETDKAAPHRTPPDHKASAGNIAPQEPEMTRSLAASDGAKQTPPDADPSTPWVLRSVAQEIGDFAVHCPLDGDLIVIRSEAISRSVRRGSPSFSWDGDRLIAYSSSGMDVRGCIRSAYSPFSSEGCGSEMVYVVDHLHLSLSVVYGARSNRRQQPPTDVGCRPVDFLHARDDLLKMLVAKSRAEAMWTAP